MFDRLLGAVAAALDARGLPYMVVGGQAVLLHGEPRLTRDIDMTLAAGPDRLDDVLEAARAAGLEPLVDAEDFTRRTLVLPCREPASGIRVDFILSFSSYEKEAIARSVVVALAGAPVRFACAEDLVVHKVLAGRPRDLEDVRGILLKNPALDHAMVRRTLGEFDAALDRGDELIARFDEIVRLTGRA